MTDHVSMQEPVSDEERARLAEQKRIEEWNHAVKVEAEVQLKAEKFREDVELAKEKMQPTLLKNRLINLLRKL